MATSPSPEHALGFPLTHLEEQKGKQRAGVSLSQVIFLSGSIAMRSEKRDLQIRGILGLMFD